MTTQPMFRENGDGYDLSPAGTFVLSAGVAYGDPAEASPEGIRLAHSFVESVLSAARAGGFTQCDILHTLLARSETGCRMLTMAQAACDAAGVAAMTALIQRLIQGGISHTVH